MRLSTLHSVYFSFRGVGQAVEAGLSCPHPGYGRYSTIFMTLKHWNKKLKEWCSIFQSVLDVYDCLSLLMGWGASCPGWLILPPPPPPATPRISERMDKQQNLLHHVLQEYLVEKDINLTAFNLRCLLQTFSCIIYWQGVGASCPGSFILPTPRPEYWRELIISKK